MEIDLKENRARMLRGELYHAFVPDLSAERSRCEQACIAFNDAKDVSRRKRVELWRQIVQDPRPLPPRASTTEGDEALFEKTDPYVLPPVHIDYGTQTHIAPGVFMNFNCTVLDTCRVTIGARTLIGPNVSFYAATHPLDPAVRKGAEGPELGKAITIGEDCWIGGNAIILPGVNLGRGCVVGAGSVVTKSVPDFWIVAGNPAKMIRKVDTEMDPEHPSHQEKKDAQMGAEVPMAQAGQSTAFDDDDQGW